MRITSDGCGKERMVNETYRHAADRADHLADATGGPIRRQR
jgi:hypothetical protein